MLTWIRIMIARWLPSDNKGAAMTEYVVLMGMVGLGVAVAIAGLGPVLVSSYERARGILLSPIP